MYIYIVSFFIENRNASGAVELSTFDQRSKRRYLLMFQSLRYFIALDNGSSTLFYKPCCHGNELFRLEFILIHIYTYIYVSFQDFITKFENIDELKRNQLII